MPFLRSTPRAVRPKVITPTAPVVTPTLAIPAKQTTRFAAAIVAALAVGKLALHVVTNLVTPYGVHRDEFLYMAMGRHLRLGAMDFPPFIALLSEVTRDTIGSRLVALRLGPALAGTALLICAALLARVMGGGRAAQALAALAVLVSPLFLRSAGLFQPVVFDQLWWTLGLYAIARIGVDVVPTAEGPRHRAWADGRPHTTPTRPARANVTLSHVLKRRAPLAALLERPAGRWWFFLGVAGGVGLLTKFSIAFFAAAALVGVLASPLRGTLRTPWPWVAALLALAIGSPSLIGQVALGWPVLGQMRELQSEQLDRVGPLDFVAGQFAVGLGVLLAVAGLWYLLTHRDTRPFRAVGWTCATAFLLLLVSRGKAYYAGPIYPALIAAGAVFLERVTYAMPLARRRGVRWGAAALLVFTGAVALPIALPLLPPPALIRYTNALGVEETSNVGEPLAISQDFADMLGWPQQAATVARVYETLSLAQREEAVLIAANYGEAGALEFYGPAFGLPPVVSTAGSFWFFGPGDRPGTTAIAIGIPPETLRRYFARVTLAARVVPEQRAWLVPEERDVDVYLCEAPFQTLQAIWPSLRPDD